METATLRKPVQVSPFIKALRYGFLIYGIIHGKFQWERYHTRQIRIREERAKAWPAIQARQKVEQMKRLTDDLKQLAEEFEIELPPGWTAEGL